MGEIVPYRPPRAREEWTAHLGMVIFLASWAMLFGSMFFAYGMVRARATAWPPPDLPALPLGVPGLNTVLLALSSVVLQLTLRALRRGKTALLGPGIGISFLLGVVFLALQILTWRSLSARSSVDALLALRGRRMGRDVSCRLRDLTCVRAAGRYRVRGCSNRRWHRSPGTDQPPDQD